MGRKLRKKERERENMVAQLFYRKQFTSCDKKVFVKNVDDDAMAG